MYIYAPKKSVKEARSFFTKHISKIRKYVNGRGITFSYILTGSAKRGMAIQDSDTKYFDCDYQLQIQKNINNLNAREIKFIFINAIKEAFGDAISSVKDKTQSIRVTFKNFNFGYDVVIVKETEHGMCLLRNKKATNNANNNDYEWSQRKNLNDFHIAYNLVITSRHFVELKDIYLKSRIENINNNDIVAYQILHRCVNELIKKYNLR